MRALDKWLLPYLTRHRPEFTGRLQVFVAVCDHFEPLHDSDKAGALKRLKIWTEKFPASIAPFRDADGQPPKHTFFYPVEQYDHDLIAPLAELCHATGSEVEIHLHHDRDTPEILRASIEKGKHDLDSHGLLCRDREGTTRYAFIHGNWALNHIHPHGKGCGVDKEIGLLRETGCYADFTMPSAPSRTQTKLVNEIAYLRNLSKREAFHQAIPAATGSGPCHRDDVEKLLTIQGPLALNWRRRSRGIFPRIENGDLTGANPPTLQRFRLALRQGISVANRPDWVFVKYHTHGGIERNFETLLGTPMAAFHQSLAECRDFDLHYVTAREMANLVHAAEDGLTGPPGEYRDYLFRR